MAEITMASVKQPEAAKLDRNPKIGQRGNQWIIGKAGEMSHHIDERHDAQAGERACEEGEFKRPTS